MSLLLMSVSVNVSCCCCCCSCNIRRTGPCCIMLTVHILSYNPSQFSIPWTVVVAANAAVAVVTPRDVPELERMIPHRRCRRRSCGCCCCCTAVRLVVTQAVVDLGLSDDKFQVLLLLLSLSSMEISHRDRHRHRHGGET